MDSKNMFISPAAQAPKWWWWLFVGGMSIVILSIPSFAELDVQLDLSIIFIYGMLALSMSFLWGYGGMLSFGQTAFFGLGGYAYAVMSLNIGTTTLPFFAAILMAMVFASIIGYFMIYGRISNIYFTVITLVLTVVLEKAVRATSSDFFVIGTVRLRGQNGISNVPDLQVPWDQSTTLFIDGVFYVAALLLIATLIGLRMLLTTEFGRVLVCIRENERRAELLGYDSRKYKLAAFILSGGIAGMAGVMYGVWGNFVAPEMMNLSSAASIAIYTIVGGKSTLIGPLVGTGVVQQLTLWLGTQGVGQVTLFLGGILMVFVMVFQEGLLPTIGMMITSVVHRTRKNNDEDRFSSLPSDKTLSAETR